MRERDSTVGVQEGQAPVHEHRSDSGADAQQSREPSLSLIINTIPAFVWTARPDGYCDFFNQRWLDYAGMAAQQAEGWGWTEAIHSEDRKALAEYWQSCLASGSPGATEARMRRFDGTYRWFLFRTNPLRDASGNIVKWYGSNVDIEDHRRVEDALRAGELSWREIVDNVPGIVATMTPMGEVGFLNRQTLDYFGKTPEDLRKNWAISDAIHPEDMPRVIEARSRSIEKGQLYEVQHRCRRADGTYHWFQVRGVPARNEEGAITAWYFLLTDIDDLKRAEAELRELKDQLYKENLVLRDEVDRTSMFEEVVGTSSALKAVLAHVAKVARTDSTVLITGETGTGKELIARAVHRCSGRASRAFVSVNCAATPRELIASELFGHEKGAFTGATQPRLGRFELAQGGTIFLDEVGELPLETQVALLRVLQEREFERVGGSASIHVDVRVVAATNRDLLAAVESGTFRSDLFYRLNVFPIAVPALRDRSDDIPLLVEYFIDRYARQMGKTIRRVNKRTLDRLRSYSWPGNVRELQNVIERSVIVCDGEEFIFDESWISARPTIEGRHALSGSLAAHEKTLIEDALKATAGRVFGPSGAAQRLGIPRSTLESKIRSLGIDKSRFRPRPVKR